MSRHEGQDRSADAPRILRVDAAHGPVGGIADNLARQEEQQHRILAGRDPQANLQQLYQQARELVERLRQQQRRLNQRQADLEIRSLQQSRTRAAISDPAEHSASAEPASDSPAAGRIEPFRASTSLSGVARRWRQTLRSQPPSGLDLETWLGDAPRAAEPNTASFAGSLDAVFADLAQLTQAHVDPGAAGHVAAGAGSPRTLRPDETEAAAEKNPASPTPRQLRTLEQLIAILERLIR